MPELSPAAQAIVQPFNDDWDEYCLAAELRGETTTTTETQP